MASLIGAIGFIIFVVTTLSNRKAAPSTPGRIPRFMWVLALVMRLNFLGFWFAISASIGKLAGILSLLATVWLLAPEIWIRAFVRPIAPPRAVYWVRRYSTFIEAIMPTGISTMHAAVALTRKPAPRTLDWLGTKLTRMRFPSGAAIVAAGLLAAMRGDRHRASSLMSLADALPPHLLAEGARAIARDWLVVEAARVGDWRETLRLGRRGLRSLRFSYAVARMGERHDGGKGALADAWLVMIWLLAPRRRATLPMLRLALRNPRVQADEPPLPERDGPLSLAQCLRAFPGDACKIADGIAVVDAALDKAATREHVRLRLVELGARRDPEIVLQRAKERLQELLTPLIEVSPHWAAQAGKSCSLDAAVATRRARLYRDVEARCADYERRRKESSSLEAINEWEAWAMLRYSAEQVLALSPSERPTLFPIMYAPVNNFAVFQQNSHKRPVLAHDMYSWLLEHCGEDASARVLLSTNAKRTRS